MNIINTTEAISAKRSLLLCAAAVAALSAAGCASESEGQDQLGAEPLALQAPSGEQGSADPNGSYFVSVTANGTGCPANSWSTEISEDGKTFTTSFSEYEAEVSRSQVVQVKDCQLNIKLHSPQGLSFSVQEFYYGGYVYLDEGVNLRQIANYYFSGNPEDGVETSSEFVGPYDDTWTIKDVRKDLDVVWSPCGVDRNLQIRTTLRLRNTVRRNGYANLAAVDGSTDTKLRFRLNWRRCRD